MSKEWCACLTVDTVTPRATSSGISAAIRVVFPLPLQPARPKIRIRAYPCTLSWGETAAIAMRLLSRTLGFPAIDRGPRPGVCHMAQSRPQVVIPGHQCQRPADPTERVGDLHSGQDAT